MGINCVLFGAVLPIGIIGIAGIWRVARSANPDAIFVYRTTERNYPRVSTLKQFYVSKNCKRLLIKVAAFEAF